MNTFHIVHRVHYKADQMYQLVADVEQYPQFLPLCETLEVLRHEHNGTHDVIVAHMTAVYKFIRETLTSRVSLDPGASEILVEYIDGPFSHMENRWRFRKVDDAVCDVEFFIAYEFRSHVLQLLMGALFNKAFHKFVDAFENRARQIYGPPGRQSRPEATDF